MTSLPYVLEQCRQSGASLAGIALDCGINLNMVCRWMWEDRQRLELIELQRRTSAFVPLQLPPSSSPGVGAGQGLAKCVQPAADQSVAAEGNRVEIQGAGDKVTVTWPLQSAGEWASGCGSAAMIRIDAL